VPGKILGGYVLGEARLHSRVELAAESLQQALEILLGITLLTLLDGFRYGAVLAAIGKIDGALTRQPSLVLGSRE
jgi:hypothetical protein